jgi:thiol-disulfide isomerase/thioredoxin
MPSMSSNGRVRALVAVVTAGLVLASPGCAHYGPPAVVQETTGRRDELTSFRGHVVLLNFWADWCRPCMIEIPQLMQVAARYGRRALFLAVYYGDEARHGTGVRGWMSRQKSPFVRQICWGNSTLLAKYMHEALPTTYVLGCDGEIVDTFTGSIFGEVREQALVQDIERALQSAACVPAS